MKITTAMLISSLAFGSTIVFAQNASAPAVKVAPGQTVTINAVMKPVEKSDSEQFHVNRSAALNSSLTTTIRSRQLEDMPLKDGNPLNAIAGR